MAGCKEGKSSKKKAGKSSKKKAGKGNSKGGKIGKKPAATAGTGGKADKCVCPAPGADSAGGGPGRGRRTRRKETYSTYIYRVLRSVHPQTGISKLAMGVMNSFVVDLFEKISNESAHLTKVVNKATIGHRDVQSAVRLLLPGELAAHAVTEGMKVVTLYNRSAPSKPKGGKKPGGGGKGSGDAAGCK